jgi:hypothetical protein
MAYKRMIAKEILLEAEERKSDSGLL